MKYHAKEPNSQWVKLEKMKLNAQVFMLNQCAIAQVHKSIYLPLTSIILLLKMAESRDPTTHVL